MSDPGDRLFLLVTIALAAMFGTYWAGRAMLERRS